MTAAPPLVGTRLAARRWGSAALAAVGDPMGPLLRRRPEPDLRRWYADLLAGPPVRRSATGAVLVARHDLCDRLLRDPRLRVRDADGRSAEHDPLVGTLGGALSASFLELDPPEHARLRRLVAPAFRPRLVRARRERIAALVRDLVDDGTARGRGELDVVTALARPLPVTVIAELLGVPDAEAARFAELGDVLGNSISGVWSADQRTALLRAGEQLTALFRDLHRQRDRVPAGGDVLSLLALGVAEERLTAEELVEVCGLLLVAGFETTVNLIGNAVVALAAHPGEWRRLRDDPGLVPSAVEEVLRWDAPVQATTRVTAEPVDVGGEVVPAGTRVVLVLGAAGRDPAVHADPDRFDVARAGEPEHLAFGSGIHYCLGAPLARVEAELALRELVERLPLLELSGPPVRRPGNGLRGFTTVRVAVPPGRS